MGGSLRTKKKLDDGPTPFSPCVCAGIRLSRTTSKATQPPPAAAAAAAPSVMQRQGSTSDLLMRRMASTGTTMDPMSSATNSMSEQAPVGAMAGLAPRE